jgi:hypothetical protein
LFIKNVPLAKEVPLAGFQIQEIVLAGLFMLEDVEPDKFSLHLSLVIFVSPVLLGVLSDIVVHSLHRGLVKVRLDLFDDLEIFIAL